MGRSGERQRKGRVVLWTIAGLLILLGGAIVAALRGGERRQCDARRMEKLAQIDFAPSEPNKGVDWPQWRGPNRDGFSTETGLLTTWPASGPPLLWKRLIGRGFSSVVIAAGRLYTMEEETLPSVGQAFQPDCQAGQAFQPDSQAGQAFQPDSQAGKPDLQTPRCEAVVCLDARTGNEIWRFRYASAFEERFGSGPRSTPVVDGDRVYAVGATGIFHCLRADTGAKIWRHDLMEEFHGRKTRYGVSFSPLIEGDLVYTTPGGPNGNAVVAFHKRTGAVAWKALDDEMGYSSPIAATAAGVRQMLFFTNTALVSLSPQDGKLLWRHPWKTEGGFNIATPLAFGDYVFISSAYGKGCALLEIAAEADGSLHADRVYEHNRMRNYFASSVRFGEHIYGLDMTDLVCMEVRTGRIVWREKGGRAFGKGSLLIADGHLIVLGEGGTLTLAEATPAGYREKASFSLSSNKCWTAPSLAGGKLYVRNESQIYCLDLSAPN